MTSQRPWNRDAKEHVLHDPRNFIVGLSDEGGAGANVGFASKQHYAPVQAEVAALDMYINSTLWGAHCPAAPIEYQANCSLQVQTSELRCLFFFLNIYLWYIMFAIFIFVLFFFFFLHVREV